MTLQNFEKSREAMVVSQLQPSGIVSEDVMAAYRAVPREMFVPNALRGVSYLDDDIALGNGRFLMEPLIHARMVQDADILSSDKILDIGGGTGYSAAVLAHLGGNVVAVDEDDKLLQGAATHWNALNLPNIMPVIGRHAEGYYKDAPYNVIIVNGAVQDVPQALINQLSDGGRLYFVLQEAESGGGELMVVVRESSGQILQRSLGAAATNALKGFEKPPVFAF